MSDILSREKVVLTGLKGKGCLYSLDVPNESALLASSLPSMLENLHFAFGHMNYSALVLMIKEELIEGIRFSEAELKATLPPGKPCAEGKSHCTSFPC